MEQDVRTIVLLENLIWRETGENNLSSGLIGIIMHLGFCIISGHQPVSVEILQSLTGPTVLKLKHSKCFLLRDWLIWEAICFPNRICRL